MMTRSNPEPRQFGVLMCLLLLAGVLCAGQARAEVRAWLDRDRIALGDTVTLNIEADGTTDSPDWAPLSTEFDVSGHTSQRSMEFRNGSAVSKSLFGVALRPRREGVVTVPALTVGAQKTAPLSLSVGPARVQVAGDGSPAFIEAETDVQSPYVQQIVSHVLRLYYDAPLLSGALEQPEPEGASMQRIGDDLQFTRDVGGHRYNVLERRYRIVPERSGRLTIPGARFEGRGAGGGRFGGVFGGRGQVLRANGPPSVVDVLPMPDGAPQPWLPLYGLEMHWLQAPTHARAGEAVELVLQAELDGAVGSRLPDIELPTPDGAQVFAEPPQYDERFEDGHPRVRVTRRWSVVPGAAGSLQLQGPAIDWWDARAGRARQATVPPVVLAVSAGAAAPADGAGGAGEDASADAPSTAVVPPVSASAGPWRGLALLFAALWLATSGLAWWLYRRGHTIARPRPPRRAPVFPSDPGRRSQSAAGSAGLAPLMQALRIGDPQAVEDALRALLVPEAADLDALAVRLGDDAQRAALAQWRQARWRDGDLPSARDALRTAFRNGVHWRDAELADAGDTDLPPLYPER